MDSTRTDRRRTPSNAGSTSSRAGRFAGKVVVITGAGDRGIGGAVAEQMANEGADLVLITRREPKRLLKRLARKETNCRWYSCDVTDSDAIEATFSSALQWRSKLDILINNAGIDRAKRLADSREDEWREIIDVNLNGAIAMTRAVLEHLASPGGVIVNVSSALALGGCPGFAAYSASKAGLQGFTQSLAWELAPQSIRVVAVAPAFVSTPMTWHYGEHLTPDRWEQLQNSHPLGIATPHEVAAPILFLASREAKWITGITLPLGFAPSYHLPIEQLLDNDTKPKSPPK